MKCPACFAELKPVPVGPLEVDVCQGGCGGIWFDAFELPKVDEAKEAGAPLLEVRRDEQMVVDLQRKRECPRCAGIKLYRHFFSARRKVQVDQCPNCAGYWLDWGELAALRAEHAATEQTRNARGATISSEFIRYLYNLESASRAQPPSEG